MKQQGVWTVVGTTMRQATMRQTMMRQISFCAFCIFGLWGMTWVTTTWATEPVHVPSPAVSSVAAAASLNDKDQKILLNQFVSAQKTAILALDHRQRFEFKALKESQRVQAKEWEKKERELRHQFFAAHPQGAMRREYVHTFIQRRDEFYRAQSAEKKRIVQEQEQKLKAVHQEHVMKLREFNHILKQGQKPTLELWPQE